YDVFKVNHPWSEHQTLENTVYITEHEWQPMHAGTVRYL
ncbi:unnamed protein product, partial [marine sediment metagenome]